jgi:vancomycin resistance protein YoaR
MLSQETIKKKVFRREFALVILLFALLAVYCLFRPFVKPVGTAAQSIAGLSSAQRENILLACQAIDGCVIRPGESFSFNKIVGPRTEGRGYRLAPSYLGGQSPNTLGGGICLLSSLLYQAALKADLKITERKAHRRPIKTVPPGLDATVWYGGANLSFENTSAQPVQIKAKVYDDELAIVIMSDGEKDKQEAKLATTMTKDTNDRLRVAVFKTSATGTALVSRDIYRLSR